MKVTMKRMIASVLAICTIYSTTAVTVSAASTSTAISQSASECAEQNLTSGDFEYRDTVITNRLNGSVHFTVNGAKIQSIDSSNIRLGWDFAASSDVSVQIDDNRKGFTVRFLVDMQTTPNEMGLIKVDGATIIKDGEVKNISQEFQIAHGYEPNSVLAEIEKDDTVERIAKGILKSSVAIAQNAIGKKIYTLNDDKVISSPTYGFCAWLTDFLGEETVQLLTGEEDDGISRALESMEANLRREINNSTDALKSEMQDVYNKLDNKLSKINSVTNYGKLKAQIDNIDIQYGLDFMNAALAFTDCIGEAEDSENIDMDAIHRIYHISDANGSVCSIEKTDFYKELYALGSMICGTTNDSDAFTNYEEVLAAYYNYNTQTFAEREQFLEKIPSLYERYYQVMNAALKFQQEELNIKAEIYSSTLKKTKDTKTQLSTKGAGAIKLAAFTSKINELSNAERKCNTAIQTIDRKIGMLTTQYNTVQELKKIHQDKLDNEKKRDIVHCYRNNTDYSRTLSVQTIDGNMPAPSNTLQSNQWTDYFYMNGGKWSWSVELLPLNNWKNITESGHATDATIAKANPVLKNSAAYAKDSHKSVKQLQEYAAQRGVTFGEDIASAFRLGVDANGNDIKTNAQLSGYGGVYNGGTFHYESQAAGEKHLGSTYPLWIELKHYADSYNYKFCHDVDYINANGDSKKLEMYKKIDKVISYTYKTGFTDNMVNQFDGIAMESNLNSINDNKMLVISVAP